jgi:hypothetical protein
MFNVCIFQHDVIQLHMNYQGGDIGCGFCKYDITTADIDNRIDFGIMFRKNVVLYEY